MTEKRCISCRLQCWCGCIRGICLNNSLFNAAYIENELPKIPAFQEDILSVFEQVKRIYNADRFRQGNEATTEIDFIKALLEILGWTGIYQASFTLQGRNIRPDWTLLPDEETRKSYDAAAVENRLPLVTAFCESKAYGVKLDSGKVDKTNNPHFQLIDYLNTLRVRYGFRCDSAYPIKGAKCKPV